MPQGQWLSAAPQRCLLSSQGGQALAMEVSCSNRCGGEGCGCVRLLGCAAQKAAGRGHARGVAQQAGPYGMDGWQTSVSVIALARAALSMLLFVGWCCSAGPGHGLFFLRACSPKPQLQPPSHSSSLSAHTSSSSSGSSSCSSSRPRLPLCRLLQLYTPLRGQQVQPVSGAQRRRWRQLVLLRRPMRPAAT